MIKIKEAFSVAERLKRLQQLLWPVAINVATIIANDPKAQASSSRLI